MENATPTEAAVAVVSKGDPRLVEFAERSGRHFPADTEGRYAGYYPRTSEEAIAQLEAIRAEGTEFLCLPATALWWLDHYAGLAAWLGVHCRVVADQRDTCIVYDLLSSPAEAAADAAGAAPNGQLRALLDAILPEGALVFAIGTDGAGLATAERTVSPLGRGNPRGLERRLDAASSQGAFVLVSKRPADPLPEPELERILDGAARLIASRAGLCDLYEVPPADGGRGPGPRPEGPPQTKPLAYLDSEKPDKLSNRLERLGLGGDDAAATAGKQGRD
ncbi:MAG TPA: hypothetical protein VFJ53_01105 [Solirubrobacterales bacterium]|nr:hypothetical protein [Solirubrobacterales bacterium]